MNPLTLMNGLRRPLRALAAGAFAIALSLPAAAHVTIDPPQAAAGSYLRAAFRVPLHAPPDALANATGDTAKNRVSTPVPVPVALALHSWGFPGVGLLAPSGLAVFMPSA